MENVTALLLTAYEKYGALSMNDYVECFIDENLDSDNVDLSAYAEYLINNNYEPWESMDSFDEICEGIKPHDLAVMVKFGNFSPNQDYFKLDGNGNFKSCYEYEVKREAANDYDFLKWYVEENNLIDEEEAEKVIAEANALVRKGY